ncbi:scarecrow-like protein 28 [Impatiens glandulifera]|uniref:scarecrow-like protein 28 n=1 Tax=Impatiens glandulifera TaxID=253017 RepID=UPI001FB11FB6|nr:scarecrow-like protein 28 [Impatiens glandulifera]
MLAGCSTSLVSPRHRLRSEATTQFEACNFTSMSTQRLDLPCSFPRKDASRSQPIRPVGISVEKKPIETKPKTSCSLKQKIRLPPLAAAAVPPQPSLDEFWNKGKSLKRFADQSDEDNNDLYRAKRKRGGQTFDNDSLHDIDDLSLIQLGNGNFWFQPHFEDRVFPWSKSIANEIADLGEKPEQQQPDQWAVKEGSAASSSSSDSQSWSIKLTQNPSDHETGNGSGGQGVMTAGHTEIHGEENQEIELISLLVACVDSISSKNIPGINHFMAKLGELASPTGSPISRLIAYFSEALALRVARQWPRIFQIAPPYNDRIVEDDTGMALRVLNQVSPIPKFIQFTSNEILLRAFEGKDRIHIIDFDIKQGLQWPSFFQSLASRSNPPIHVRITGIGESKQELIETGDRLAGFADSLNLAFEFHPVVDRLEDVRLWMLHVKEGENVGVNCVLQLHKLLYDETGGAVRDFLGLIQSTKPIVVVIAEQEADHNQSFLEARLCNSLKYYSAIFDSINSSGLSSESLARIKIEEMLGREIRSIVSFEGHERIERHEKFTNWKRMMGEGGFNAKGVSEREFLQSRMLMKMYSSDSYNVEKQEQEQEQQEPEQEGGNAIALTIRWMDQPLYTVSAWGPNSNSQDRIG